MNRRLSPAGRITLVALFFAWGVTGVLVRMTVPHFKEAFHLGFRDALLVQSAFFLTYLLFARISGAITARIGLRNGASLGLFLMALGAGGLASATLLKSFVAMLPSVFVIASGITFLQVSANPLAAVEGSLRSASGNLTFAQGFNSLGTVAAPLIAGAAFLGTVENPLVPVRWLFVAVCVCLLVLATCARTLLREVPSRHDEPDDAGRAFGPFEQRRLAAAVAAIFFYVGAEVAISTTLVNLLEDDGIIAAGRTSSALLTSIFWVGMMTGRFVSVPLLVRFDRGVVLAMAALVSATLCVLGATLGGTVAAAAILATGLSGGLQFPTIFTIGSADLEPKARAKAAGWLCTGIVGGGVIPLFYGEVADRVSLEAALTVPALCFLYVLTFGWLFGRVDLNRKEPGQVRS